MYVSSKNPCLMSGLILTDKFYEENDWFIGVSWY